MAKKILEYLLPVDEALSPWLYGWGNGTILAQVGIGCASVYYGGCSYMDVVRTPSFGAKVLYGLGGTLQIGAGGCYLVASCMQCYMPPTALVVSGMGNVLRGWGQYSTKGAKCIDPTSFASTENIIGTTSKVVSNLVFGAE